MNLELTEEDRVIVIDSMSSYIKDMEEAKDIAFTKQFTSELAEELRTIYRQIDKAEQIIDTVRRL